MLGAVMARARAPRLLTSRQTEYAARSKDDQGTRSFMSRQAHLRLVRCGFVSRGARTVQSGPPVSVSRVPGNRGATCRFAVEKNGDL